MTKEKFAWSGFGIPLSWLAELDNAPSQNGLRDAFGDRYLCTYCPVFASVREAVVRLGYRFSPDDTRLWRDYQAFPLTALHRILSERVIPYFDTGAAFRRLAAAYPSARLSPGFIVANLKKNYVFHESAHCVAHETLGSMGTELKNVAPCERNRAVLQAILAESYANSIESIGCSFQHMPVSDRVFYALNCYFAYDEKRQNLLDRAMAELGGRRSFTVLFLSYFEANLTTQAPSAAAHERIAAGARFEPEQAALAREITDMAFQLNIGFRESTTPAYFELLGLGCEYQALANGDWLGQRDNQDFIAEVAERLWEAARG